MKKEEFIKKAKNLGLTITDVMFEQFETYFKNLVEYNQKVNLTSITEKEEVFLKHFLDSIISHKLIQKDASVCDIGTGAGFPGIPLKIIRPDIKLTLVDSLHKRVVFLQELANKLKLEDVSIFHSRAEDFAKTHRERFDVCVARAVASLNTLSEYCLPFVKVSGSFLAYKAINIEEELVLSKHAISVLGGKIKHIEPILLPETDIIRNIVVIQKIMPTPVKYPRDKNKPKTQPL